MRTGLAVVLMCPVVWASAALPQGTTSADTVVLMSASGGIAKGSYQGGVDFAINEFLRRQRIRAFRQHLKEIHEREAEERAQRTLTARLSRLWRKTDQRTANHDKRVHHEPPRACGLC